MLRKRLAGRFLRTTMLSGVAAAAAMPAVAQDDSDDVIIVSGTRIQREDLSAPSPVTTVTSEQLTLTNAVNSEQFLNTLPQVIPAFDSTSNNPGNGTATVSLRGLGTARTLVLVDGQRFVPSDVNGVVDLNNIPTALVERIDVVTGGASAVYGSDAVAGVVNFIMKDDFEGVQLDVSDEMSASGWDANVFNAALTMGGNFADGRGNAVLSMSYTNREALFQGDRDFSSESYFDLGPGNTEFGLGGSSNIPGTRFRGATDTNFNLTGAQVGAVDPACGAMNEVGACLGFRLDEGGDLRGLRFGSLGGGTGSETDLYNYAPANYLQLPQERYNISGFATFEINEGLEAYARGIFANNVVDSQLAPTPAFHTITVNLDNPSIPTDLLAIIAGDPGSNNGDGTATIRVNKRYEEIGTRNSLRDTSAFQTVVGLRGDITPTWQFDTFFNFSRSSVSQIQSGNVSDSAVRQGALCDNGPTGSADPNCAGVPYVDFFGGPGGISPEGAQFISRTGAIIDTVEQIQWVGLVTGDLAAIKTPWAEESAAIVLGAEYRESSAESRPDSVLGPDVAGFNQSLPVKGRFDVYELFTEVDIPLVSGAPGMESLDLNGAYRYSDYSIAAVGSTHTFAAGLDYVPVEGLRLRGQFQRAVRAPNVGDLFAPLTNGFPGAQDPCSDGTADPALCVAYGMPPAAFGTNFQSNGQIEALFGGNPDLFEETADTWTVGMVWQPAAVEGLTFQVDYFNIQVEDAIATPPLQSALNDCFIAGMTDVCDAYFSNARNPTTGEIARPFLPNLNVDNISSLKVEGVDFNLSYSYDIGEMGMLTAQYYGTYTIENSYRVTDTSDLIDCVGLYGGNCGEPTPTYKHAAQFGWLYGPLTTNLRWRYIGAVDADIDGVGFSLSDLSDDISAYNYLDITMQYAVNENLDLTVGVQNITGKDAPLLGSTVNEQANTWPATYETLGRQLFVGASVRF